MLDPKLETAVNQIPYIAQRTKDMVREVRYSYSKSAWEVQDITQACLDALYEMIAHQGRVITMLAATIDRSSGD